MILLDLELIVKIAMMFYFFVNQFLNQYNLIIINKYIKNKVGVINV